MLDELDGRAAETNSSGLGEEMRMTIAGQAHTISDSRRRGKDGLRREAITLIRGLSRSRLWLSSIAVAACLGVAPASGYAETGGAAVGWGRNAGYQLGAGYRTSLGGEETPVSVLGMSNVTAVDSGYGFGLALLGNGTLRAWGGNTFGQLGNGTRENTKEEVSEEEEASEENKSTVSGLSEVQAISVGGAHALALLNNNTVMAWGTNQDGEHGNGTGGTEKETGETDLVPVAVKGLGEVTTIASGGGSNFALLGNGKMMAWGKNDKGQLGLGTGPGKTGPDKCITEVGEESCSTTPRPVLLPKVVTEGKAHVIAISAGNEFALALLSNGSVYAWGDNGKGQLGTGGSNTNFDEPQLVARLGEGEEAVAISAGAEHALALLGSGKVLGWGANGSGELGESSESAELEECQKVHCHKTPQLISKLSSVTAISAGTEFSLALSAGKAYAFGSNRYGRLGTGSTAEKSKTPTAIEGIGTVTTVAAGEVDGFGVLQHGVAGPAPQVTLTPGVESLEVSWTFSAKEYKVRNHPVSEPHNFSKSHAFFAPGSYLFSELRPEPYVVGVTVGQKSRTIIGTPLA